MALRKPVYLVDFSVYKPPEETRFEYRKVMEIAWTHPAWKKVYTEENRMFIAKVLEMSGLSHTGTFVPNAIHPGLTDDPKTDMATSLIEARQVMIGAVTDVLNKTGIKPEQVDILVTNCSIFCPTPSLGSMLINHFKFREDIQSYNLGGMGCSNGVVSVGLVKDLLQARPNSVALFVPAEITTYCNYLGSHKKYHVATAIFRMGGAAAVISNKASLGRRAKYILEETERVHTGGDDRAYQCMAWQPDPDGVHGVYLGKDVVEQAGIALKKALRKVAPKIMTWRQYAEAAKHMHKQRRGKAEGDYKLDFTRTIIDHFAIHAGGYSVLKGVQKGMMLPHSMMLPSFAALRDYGNTSCSTTWYVMGYMETIKSIRRGQRVLQIGLGGGMKCGVNVWRALRDTADIHPAWEHLANTPLTEADLPRAIENDTGKNFTPEPVTLRPDVECRNQEAREAAGGAPTMSKAPGASMVNITAAASCVATGDIEAH